MDIHGKHFLVTGGSSGIGLGLSCKLLEEGALVTVIDLQPPPADLEDFQSFKYFSCDISNPVQVESALALANKELGPIHCLVNNAGIMHSEPLVNLLNKIKPQHSLEAWNKVLSINLTGSFLVTRIVATNMIQHRIKGLIINVSSICSKGNIGQSAYSASKAGLEAMTHVWAKELNPMGIRCCCLSPGFVETTGAKAALNPNILESWISQVPLKRLATVDELVQGMLFLIENDFFNGKVLSLDGGLRI